MLTKDRPAWQHGLLNGIGGKCEAGETQLAALVREFHEEAGVQTEPDDWTWIADIIADDATWHVRFFRTFHSFAWDVRTMEEESVRLYTVARLEPEALVPHLNFIIPLALNPAGIMYPVTFYDNLHPAGDKKLRNIFTEICTRVGDHICKVNGPCNGLPR